ncbi:hypothetical protein PR048_006053 [Dryococelus australis]|uniref:Uncharacterized protein n=1 Tax=Dryococelus australis TaxID=614101 RepID=A0ABQ9IB26_9NEOP|nr:hypothetical protein PR048_006053 [Dryococelus australis]
MPCVCVRVVRPGAVETVTLLRAAEDVSLCSRRHSSVTVDESLKAVHDKLRPVDAHHSGTSGHARAGKAEVPRENPPESGIVHHDSHMRRSGSGPTGYRARIAVVGGERSSHCSNAANMGGGAHEQRIQPCAMNEKDIPTGYLHMLKRLTGTYQNSAMSTTGSKRLSAKISEESGKSMMQFSLDSNAMSLIRRDFHRSSFTIHLDREVALEIDSDTRDLFSYAVRITWTVELLHAKVTIGKEQERQYDKTGLKPGRCPIVHLPQDVPSFTYHIDSPSARVSLGVMRPDMSGG